jgi:soluble lytic murein transglycosylase
MRGRAAALPLGLLALATATGCAWLAKPPPAPPRPAPAPEAAPPPAADRPADDLMDATALGPYFASVRDGAAAKALAEDRTDEAARLFDEMAMSAADPAIALRARFMAAYLAARRGDDVRALAELPGLARELPLVADTARLAAAEAAMRLGKPAEALDLATAIPEGSMLAPEASDLRAKAERALEPEADAGAGPSLGPEPEPRAKEPKAAIEAYDKAADLMRHMRHPLAEQALARVIRLARPNGELQCRARHDLATVASRLRDHERAARLFEDAVKGCEDPDLRVKSLYRGAKAYESAGRCEDAMRLYSAVESEFKDHSYADDARLHGAVCALALGDRARFEAMLATLPDAYPQGDMRAEALWILAMDGFEQGQVDRACEAMRRYHELFPIEEGWYAAGRSGYWLGRAEELLGDTASAASRYEQVVSTAPFTWYMVLAFDRLAALDAARARGLLARLAPATGERPATFRRALLDEVPGLATGIELLRLGLATRARRDLDAILARPRLPSDVYWLVAALYRGLGDFDEVRDISSRAGSEWSRRYPSGQDLLPWTLAFPKAYEAEVAAASAESKVREPLLWAVMREESGFNSGIESWANAIGLMQIILPTARRVGKGLGIGATPGSLRDPAINIRIGAAYLAHLAERFDGNPALMVAGYNAGEGAVAKWLKARPGSDLDLFVERIPYDQTRGYTKRVLASLATYGFLYGPDRPMLALPLVLP